MREQPGRRDEASRRLVPHAAWWPLSVALFAGGVLCVVIGVAPPSGAPGPVAPVAGGVVLVLVALGLALFRGAPPSRQTALWVTIVTVGAMLSQTVTVAGQLLLGHGVVLAALYAATILTGRTLAFFLATAVLAISVGMLVSPGPFVVVAWLVTVGTVVLTGTVTGRYVRSLSAAASTDYLTGALNRTGLATAAGAAIAAAHRHGAPLSVVLIDLDEFKAVNDTLGHAGGDRLLVALVEEWWERLRGQDLVARIGGDEFVLVLPDTDPDGAAAILAELRHDAPARWTAGIATLEPEEDLESLVRRADRELYRRKKPPDAVKA